MSTRPVPRLSYNCEACGLRQDPSYIFRGDERFGWCFRCDGWTPSEGDGYQTPLAGQLDVLIRQVCTVFMLVSAFLYLTLVVINITTLQNRFIGSVLGAIFGLACGRFWSYLQR